MNRLTWLLLVLAACGVETDVEPTLVESDVAEVEQDAKADVLVVKELDTDVATGTLEGRYARVFTSTASARAFLGGALPSIDFSRNWLVAYRPDGKTPTSRVVVTRAQLSATGQTLSLWATVTEPGVGCQAWLPNEVSVVRVPRRAMVPPSIRVTLTRATGECGLIAGPTCTPVTGASCPSATPLCLGAYEISEGQFSQGRCVKLPKYEGSSAACTTDAACGAGGICAGASLSNGLCQPSWMRGTYSMPESGQLSAPLPQGGAWHRTVLRVTGQASVPMDAWVQVFVDGIAPSRVEWRLLNKYESSSGIVRGTSFGTRHPVYAQGDESLNGEWVLEVRDVGTGPQGVFRGARVSFTSRWD